MLTLILLGLLGGSSWFGSRQFKRARRAEDQLRRIAAVSDEQVLAVLEASDTPLAERLLLMARTECGSILDNDRWCTLIEDISMRAGECEKLAAAQDYVGTGILVTEKQYLELVKVFADKSYQDLVRRLLKPVRVERRQHVGTRR